MHQKQDDLTWHQKDLSFWLALKSHESYKQNDFSENHRGNDISALDGINNLVTSAETPAQNGTINDTDYICNDTNIYTIFF